MTPEKYNRILRARSPIYENCGASDGLAALVAEAVENRATLIAKRLGTDVKEAAAGIEQTLHRGEACFVMHLGSKLDRDGMSIQASSALSVIANEDERRRMTTHAIWLDRPLGRYPQLGPQDDENSPPRLIIAILALRVGEPPGILVGEKGMSQDSLDCCYRALTIFYEGEESAAAAARNGEIHLRHVKNSRRGDVYEVRANVPPTLGGDDAA